MFDSLIKDKQQMQTGGLETILNFAIGSIIMIMQNISVTDRLVNGKIGEIVHVKSQPRSRLFYISQRTPWFGLMLFSHYSVIMGIG